MSGQSASQQSQSRTSQKIPEFQKKALMSLYGNAGNMANTISQQMQGAMPGVVARQDSVFNDAQQGMRNQLAGGVYGQQVGQNVLNDIMGQRRQLNSPIAIPQGGMQFQQFNPVQMGFQGSRMGGPFGPESFQGGVGPGQQQPPPGMNGPQQPPNDFLHNMQGAMQGMGNNWMQQAQAGKRGFGGGLVSSILKSVM